MTEPHSNASGYSEMDFLTLTKILTACKHVGRHTNGIQEGRAVEMVTIIPTSLPLLNIFHPFPTVPVLFKVTGELEHMPNDLGGEAGCKLDWLTVSSSSQTDKEPLTLTFTPTVNLVFNEPNVTVFGK